MTLEKQARGSIERAHERGDHHIAAVHPECKECTADEAPRQTMRDSLNREAREVMDAAGAGGANFSARFGEALRPAGYDSAAGHGGHLGDMTARVGTAIRDATTQGQYSDRREQATKERETTRELIQREAREVAQNAADRRIAADMARAEQERAARERALGLGQQAPDMPLRAIRLAAAFDSIRSTQSGWTWGQILEQVVEQEIARSSSAQVAPVGASPRTFTREEVLLLIDAQVARGYENVTAALDGLRGIVERLK